MNINIFRFLLLVLFAGIVSCDDEDKKSGDDNSLLMATWELKNIEGTSEPFSKYEGATLTLARTDGANTYSLFLDLAGVYNAPVKQPGGTWEAISANNNISEVVFNNDAAQKVFNVQVTEKNLTFSIEGITGVKFTDKGIVTFYFERRK